MPAVGVAEDRGVQQDLALGVLPGGDGDRSPGPEGVVHGARGIVNTVNDQSQLSTLAMMVDAYRALALLSEHPRIDRNRIAVMGFSKGAVAAVYSAVERFHSMYGPGVSFAGHAPNNVAIVAALLCMGMLTLATYRSKPLLPVSILATLAWLIALLAVVVTMLTDYRVAAPLGGGLYCSEINVNSMTESSEILEIFRRHLFIDHRIYMFTYDDPHADLPPLLEQPDAPAHVVTARFPRT